RDERERRERRVHPPARRRRRRRRRIAHDRLALTALLLGTAQRVEDVRHQCVPSSDARTSGGGSRSAPEYASRCTSVFGPTMPSGSSRCRRWNSRTARSSARSKLTLSASRGASPLARASARRNQVTAGPCIPTRSTMSPLGGGCHSVRYLPYQ